MVISLRRLHRGVVMKSKQLLQETRIEPSLPTTLLQRKQIWVLGQTALRPFIVFHQRKLINFSLLSAGGNFA